MFYRKQRPNNLQINFHVDDIIYRQKFQQQEVHL